MDNLTCGEGRPELYKCEGEGLILPLMNEKEWSDVSRAILYFIGLLYSFLGIAIAADVFMCAIERITSQKTKVKVSLGEEGEDSDRDDLSDIHPVYKEVLVWNPTVANLTLMALGSSAPEILLSIIEIVGNNFCAGELGPSTIVGSAAFNLLAISAICIVSIPSGETRRIQEILVFAVTASFSVFAYIWLLIILKGFSPDQVEIWEGFMTLFLFVVLIVAAYLAEKKICIRKKQPKLSSARDAEKPLKDAADNMMMGSLVHKVNRVPYTESEWHELEKECHRLFPNLPPEELAKTVAYRIQQMQPHSSLWYRIQGSRYFSASTRTQAYWDANFRQNQIHKSQSMSTIPGAPSKRVVEFASRVYAITPGAKFIHLKVLRKGRNAKQLLFNYQTVNGQAKKNVHYLPKNETVVFEPGETEKTITIELMEEAEWKPDDVFYVRLGIEEDDKTKVGRCAPAEIVFRDPKGQPTIEFTKNHAACKESQGTVRLHIVRRGGFTGGAYIHWETTDITAENGADYIGGTGEVRFGEGEMEKYLDIAIVDDMVEEKAETFAVLLKNPSPGTELGYNARNIVTITCDDGAGRYFRQMDRMVPDFLRLLSPGKRTWKEQIIRATSVNAGDVENASFGDCLGHILCFPFKVIFSLVPPPALLGGWLTFFVALGLIGLITAIVGDLASIFGCLVGLKKSVTAITFVALGTSLPDTFASRLAAVQERTADNSIGNVTGSNSVNVFLGLGLPWFIASIYWAAKGGEFNVPSGSLGFSVGIYTMCSILCIIVLMLRRYLSLFGRAELGGPNLWKYISGGFCVTLWLLYVLLSALQAYGHI